MLKTVSTQLALASDTLSEILAKGNTSGPYNIAMDSGYGIDFSATAGTGTSELFSDYEEGVWSPIITPSVGAITSYTSSGQYTKIGRTVCVNYNFVISSNGTGSGSIKLDGLPFALNTFRSMGVGVESDSVGYNIISNAIGATSFAVLTKFDGTYPGATSHRLQGSFVYET
jgi:hypothetical protein